MSRKWGSALVASLVLSHTAHGDARVGSTAVGNGEAAQTFVLVHGALFGSSGWAPLQSALQGKGHNVVTLDVPGRASDGLRPADVNLDVAVKKVCQVVGLQKEKVVLVGHSQGGALITQALNDCGSHIKGLVYIAAVVPENGTTAFAGLDPKNDTAFLSCVVPDEKNLVFTLNREGPLEESFFQNLRRKDPALADATLASMVSEPLLIGNSKLSFDPVKLAAFPKVYVEATEDRVLTLGTQRKYQAQARFDKIYSLATSHSPFLEEPQRLAEILVSAVQDLKR